MWTEGHGGGPKDPERAALLHGTPAERRSRCILNIEPVTRAQAQSALDAASWLSYFLSRSLRLREGSDLLWVTQL